MSEVMAPKDMAARRRGKPIDVERMMIDFRELQAGIREQMSAIVFTRK